MKGLDLVDLYTEQGEGRLIQNIVLQSELFDMPIVGFENHGGRTCINNNNHWEKYFTVQEMTVSQAMKA